MKLTGFLLATTFMVSYGSINAQITLKAKNAKVEQVLKNISKQTGYQFIYEEGLLKNITADINFQNETLNTSLNEVLKKNNFTYTIHGKNIVVSASPLPKEVGLKENLQIVFKGRVLDAETNKPIQGATIVEGNASNVAQTDNQGNFSINLSSSSSKIYVRIVGYESVEVKYSSTFQEIKLKSIESNLDEVVVVGFGTQKKESVVGAITSISPKDLKVPSSSLSNAFAGRLAGVVAVQRSGEPGADGSNFWIRGIGTFAGSTSPLIFIDGVESSIGDMNNLASEAIDSFSILKDASATALYGARGANGVLLITTRRGGDMEKAKIHFRLDNTFAAPTQSFELANAVDYMNVYNYAILNRNPNETPRFSQEKIDGTRDNLDPIAFPNVDWNDVLFKDYTVNQYANFNVIGGGRRADYFVSATFNNDNGMYKKDPLNAFDNNIRQREYNLIANVGINLTKSTKAVIRLNSQLRDYNGSSSSSSTIYSRLFESPVSLFLPYYEAQSGDDHIRFGNEVGGPISSAGSAIYFNPYATMVSGSTSTFASTNIASFELNQNLDVLTKGLNIKGLISFKNWSTTDITRSFTPFYYDANSVKNADGGYDHTYNVLTQGTTSLGTTSGTNGDRLMNLNFILNWSRKFGEHDVSSMLTYLQRNYEVNNPNGGPTSNVYFNTLPYRNQGLAGRLTYGYASKYLFEANFGYSGSENFADGDRYGFFPSFGVGYLISNENFFESLKPTINSLKFRASWGLVGNDQIQGDRFPYLDYVAISGLSYTFGETWGLGGSGANVTKLGAPGARWEIGSKYNAGIDLVMFKNKLSLTADYFQEDRKDIFMQRNLIAAETGIVGANPYANLGRVKNNGFDATLSYQQQVNPDFYFNLRGTVTFAKNKLIDRDEPQLQYEYLSALGRPLNRSFGYIAEGLYKDQADIDNSPKSTLTQVMMPGDIKYKDLNEDGKIDANDRTQFGDPTVPQVTYGFGFSAQYKKLDFSAFFQGTAKTSLQMSGIHPFNGNATNLLQFIADDYWREDNPNAAYPRLVSGTSDHNNFYTSTFWNRDGSFLRLKNVEVGYTYKMARFYLMGQNLLTFSDFKHWDPELGSGNGLKYPNLRVGAIGVQLNF